MEWKRNHQSAWVSILFKQSFVFLGGCTGLWYKMSFFFTVKNIPEFGKHWPSCVWREGNKERCLYKPEIGLEQRLKLFQWPKSPTWPSEIYLRILEKREERLPICRKWPCLLSFLALAYTSGLAFLILHQITRHAEPTRNSKVFTPAAVPHITLIYLKFKMVQMWF